MIATLNLSADSSGDYAYSLQKHPEITQLLNNGMEYNGCGTFIDTSVYDDGIYWITTGTNKQILLVQYINDCTNSSIFGATLIEKDGDIYRKSSLILPYQAKVEIDGINYSVYQQSVSVENNIFIVLYDIACKEGIEFLPLGVCENDENYQVEMKYSLKNNKFILIEKDAYLVK